VIIQLSPRSLFLASATFYGTDSFPHFSSALSRNINSRHESRDVSRGTGPNSTFVCPKLVNESAIFGTGGSARSPAILSCPLFFAVHGSFVSPPCTNFIQIQSYSTFPASVISITEPSFLTSNCRRTSREVSYLVFFILFWNEVVAASPVPSTPVSLALFSVVLLQFC